MTEVINIYKEFLGFFPPHIGILLNLLILTILIVIYSVIIWKFYRILAKKNTINLNLNKYNTTQNSFLSRLFTGALYFLENLVIAPILIFIAFVVFTFFLIIPFEHHHRIQPLFQLLQHLHPFYLILDKILRQQGLLYFCKGFQNINRQQKIYSSCQRNADHDPDSCPVQTSPIPLPTPT